MPVCPSSQTHGGEMLALAVGYVTTAGACPPAGIWGLIIGDHVELIGGSRPDFEPELIPVGIGERLYCAGTDDCRKIHFKILSMAWSRLGLRPM